MKKYLTLFLFLLSCMLCYAQSNEHVVILWDVTGSLLPKEKGLKDYDGSELPTYSNGNGLFMEMKKAIIDCIEYIEEDPCNKITIITFHDIIRDCVSRNSTKEGKDALIEFVKGYKYQGHKHTNIVGPIKKFYEHLNADYIDYMFLFTDGENDNPQTKNDFIPTINSWANRTEDQHAFGFYVLVHPDADKQAIRNSVDSQNNLWIVPDAKVRIKIGSFPSVIKYNLREQKGTKTISLKGKYKDASGEVDLLSNDQYYDIICSDKTISNGMVKFEVKPKTGITPPQNHTVTLTPTVSNADQYTFVGPQQIMLEVSNLPERSLNLNVENNNFGKAKYHDSFWISAFSEEKFTPAISNIEVSFSEQARKENSSATMKVYFVDKDGSNKVTASSLNVKIKINGQVLEGDSCHLSPDIKKITMSVEGMPNTESGKYYGRIELIPSNLENCTINEVQEIYKWQFRFVKECNPLTLGVLWTLGILIALFLLWKLFLIRIVYPRFRAIKKMIIIPNQAPINISFKGARMVVLDKVMHKQSFWDCFWKGKIIYKCNPTITAPITLKPRTRGREILFVANPTNYHCTPNPIGMQPSIVTDIINNQQIDIL